MSLQKIKKYIKDVIHLSTNPEGQLLVELLIALLVGGIFILGATVGINMILRYDFETRGIQAASSFAYDMINGVETSAFNNWQNISTLQKGQGYHYYLIPQATSSVAVAGDESTLFNDIRSGLVGQWKLDEDAGTIAYDSSGNFNNGTLMNNPTRLQPNNCQVGSCIQFNGTNQYITVPDASNGSLDPTSQYSIAFWMNSTSAATYAFMISKTNSGAGGGYEVFLSGGGSVRFSSCNLTGSCSGGYFDVSTPLKYNDGKWHYVVATAQTNSTAKIYVDGTMVVQSGTVTQNNIANSYNLIIGGRGTGGGTPFQGDLDDVRIYNRALSLDEIQTLYNSSVYTKYFYITDVNRDQCAAGNITTSSPLACVGQTGISADPSTEEVTAVATWQGNRNVTFSKYLTRSNSSVIDQNDWRGGSGDSGIATAATSTFLSSSNITYTPTQQLSLTTTTASGWLTSVIYDTQNASGSAINNVMWEGTQPVGTNVQFQLAYANATSGPFTFVGSDGTGSTYFSPSSYGVSMPITTINNYRYLEYKIYLNPSGGAGPTVTDAIIGYSR